MASAPIPQSWKVIALQHPVMVPAAIGTVLVAHEALGILAHADGDLQSPEDRLVKELIG